MSIHFGTCSWKYDSWAGIIYPETGSYDFLREYSKHFGTVEVDQWFWSLFENKPPALPSQKDTRSYAETTEINFRFTIKAPNSLSLTHYYSKSAPLKPNQYFLSPALYGKFIESLGDLRHKTACVMLQFEYLNLKKMTSQFAFLGNLQDFVTSVRRDIPIGIEIRNPNYLNESYLSFLKEFNLIPVFLHGYYMPSAFPLIRKYAAAGFKTMVIRLHGPDRSGIEEKVNNVWNSVAEPRDSELAELASILAELGKETEIFVNVNNHYEGSAPLTIRRIQKLMDEYKAAV